MRVLVVSDTHGRHDNLKKAIKAVQPSRIIHLGDVEGNEDYIARIAEKLAGCTEVEMVRGNCDNYSDLPDVLVTEIGAHRAFLTHGHRYRVNYSDEELIGAALDNGADVAMYGHTHVPEIIETGDVQIINPGSISLPRQDGHKPSYIVIDVDAAGELHYKQCYIE